MKLAYFCLFLFVVSAPQAATGEATRMTGFPGSAAEDERALEERFTAGLNAANLRRWLEELSARPHHTGSPAGRQVAESLARKFRSWGFDTEIETFFALMSTPKELLVEMVEPHTYRASSCRRWRPRRSSSRSSSTG